MKITIGVGNSNISLNERQSSPGLVAAPILFGLGVKMEERKCKECGEVKTVDEFHKRNDTGGYRIVCKKCHNLACRTRYANNKEIINERRRLKWRINHKRYYEKNRDVITKRQRTYRQLNKEKHREYDLKNRQKHAKKIKAREYLKSRRRAGVIKKSCICYVCFQFFKNIQAHHEDYSKPLDVVWVCPQCHADIHKKKRKENEKSNS